jgi:protein gp37
MGQSRYRNGFEVTLQRDIVDLPLNWREPRLIFVNSMSDLFHERVPENYILRIFETMQIATWHTFQILTKRSDRLALLAQKLPWPRNVWMGVSVESPTYLFRIRDLVKVPTSVRFLSIEPLLESIPKIPLRGVDWVIVGGESGPGCRPMQRSWVCEIRDRCLNQQIPFFFKQWGGVRKKASGRVLDGKAWDQMPAPKNRWMSPKDIRPRDVVGV